MNNFIDELKVKLMNEKNISESSANLYIRNLVRLNDKKPFESLIFLKDLNDIESKLEKYSDNTKKTILASIVSILSLFKDTPSYKKIYKTYYDKMMTIGNDMKNIDTATKTNKQKINWMTWEVITDIKNKLKDAEEVTDGYVITHFMQFTNTVRCPAEVAAGEKAVFCPPRAIVGSAQPSLQHS